MKDKKFALLGILLTLIVFIVSCSAKNTMPIQLTLEDSIKEIIISKGDSYNFLNDSIYLDHMTSLVEEINQNNPSTNINYTLGNLDEDNIPELALFKGKDVEDSEDQGLLEIYKFEDQKYTLLDSISMNFDNSNYQMEIGKISKDKNGLLLNNSVGAHSGVTYGFILENRKLKSILNDKKISLISIYTQNQIKDIDNDDILEFSIYTVDPETTDISAVGSDKMTLWYKWNESDSADIVKVEKYDRSKEPTDTTIYENLNNTIETNPSDFIILFSENLDKLSNFDNAILLERYIAKLNILSYDKSIEIQSLFIKYQKNQNFDYIFSKYVTSIDKLNSIEYLNREKVLKDEIEIKKNLIENISLGYKLNTQEGIYYYMIDHRKLIDLFGDNLTREYKDYLEILSLDTKEPYLNDGALVISRENLTERILLVESFKMIYPYSDLISKVDEIYKWYVLTYFYGDNHDPNFDYETGKIKPEILKDLNGTVEKYPFTNFSDIIRDFITWVENNNGVIDDSIRGKLDKRLN